MKRVVDILLTSGETVAVEISEDDYGLHRATSHKATPGEVAGHFEDSLKKVKSLAGSIIDELQEMTAIPDEISLEFGVKLSSEANFILASGTLEANYTVQMTWKKKD